ncbi:MAG: S9 family peptidase [Anaerolineaceae bacterium]|nr:S9 family peptidase [Anaerolineaceae bacterium]
MPENKRPVTAEDLFRLVVVEEPRISPDGRYVAWVRQQAQKFSNDYRRDIWLSSRDGATCVQLTRGGADSSPRWSPDGRSLAFVSARSGSAQLYLLPVAAPGGEARQLTNMPRGVSNPVWSPDGRRIAFLAPCNEEERKREDQGVKEPDASDELAARHAAERLAQQEEQSHDPRVIRHIPYREGTTFRDGRHAQIYVIEVGDADGATCEARRLTNVATDYSSPAWEADGVHLLCIRSAHPDRPEPRRWTSLYRIDLDDGAETSLTGDEFNCADAAPAPAGDQVAFLLKATSRQPERLYRLALVSALGGEVQVLTEVFDRQVDEGSLRWSPDGRSIVFSAASDGSRLLWRLRPGDEPEALFDGTLEVLDYDLASDGAVACVISSPQDPSALHWLDAGSQSLRNLSRPNADLLDEIHVQTAREQHYSAEDGTALQGWLILPPDHEEGMQHPLIVHIHGGPQMMYSPANPPLWLEWQLHAANGYAVFFCNPRGSDGYGEAFRMALHNAWGEVAQADIMAGVDHVIAGGQIDPERLAVTGGSYGGYMTAWIIGHSDRFRAAVAQRGVYNLLSFYGVTDIPLFLSDQFDGTATQDPGLLWRHSPLAHADDIATPLLIIASEYDYRVPISESEQLFAYINLRGGAVEFVRYPREGHEHTRSGEPRHRTDGLQRALAWFDRHCKNAQ